jgi:hypothetical protein
VAGISQVLQLPLPILIPAIAPLSFSLSSFEADVIGPLVADVPSPVSTHPRIKKKQLRISRLAVATLLGLAN